MREMIVTCDRCGEVVEPHTGGVRLEVARDGESRDLLPRTYDLCRSCGNDVIAEIHRKGDGR